MRFMCHLINYSWATCQKDAIFFTFFSEVLTSGGRHTHHFVRNFRLNISIKNFEASKWEDHGEIRENMRFSRSWLYWALFQQCSQIIYFHFFFIHISYSDHKNGEILQKYRFKKKSQRIFFWIDIFVKFLHFCDHYIKGERKKKWK